MIISEKHKVIVENRKYIYIGTYVRNEKLLDSGKVIGIDVDKLNKRIYLRVKCAYCGTEYDINMYNFKNKKANCKYCCNIYENSFAYHIEVELGESLAKYWDFEKNTVNPYHVSKGSGKKVWIKCTETDYHGSYETCIKHFVNSRTRCNYCCNRTTHPKDSFAQYHIDNTDKDFINKYWSDKNTVDAWSIAPNSNKKVWIKCQEKDYHNDYETDCANFTRGRRCPYCFGKKVNYYDSFGYLLPDKVKYWNSKNNISPYEITPYSGKKFLFECENCKKIFNIILSEMSVKHSVTCRDCTISRGEHIIKEWLLYNNFNFIHDKEYFEDLYSDRGFLLRPDFILPDHKIWIEYDGEFHYRDIIKDGSYDYQLKNDEIKNEYAKEHGWKLIRIPYWEFDNIEEILNRQINNKM